MSPETGRLAGQVLAWTRGLRSRLGLNLSCRSMQSPLRMAQTRKSALQELATFPRVIPRSERSGVCHSVVVQQRPESPRCGRLGCSGCCCAGCGSPADQPSEHRTHRRRACRPRRRIETDPRPSRPPSPHGTPPRRASSREPRRCRRRRRAGRAPRRARRTLGAIRKRADQRVAVDEVSCGDIHGGAPAGQRLSRPRDLPALPAEHPNPPRSMWRRCSGLPRAPSPHAIAGRGARLLQPSSTPVLFRRTPRRGRHRWRRHGPGR